MSELLVGCYELPWWHNDSKPLLSRWESGDKWVVNAGNAVMDRTGQWAPIPPRIMATASWLRSVAFDTPEEALAVYWRAWNAAITAAVGEELQSAAVPPKEGE